MVRQEDAEQWAKQKKWTCLNWDVARGKREHFVFGLLDSTGCEYAIADHSMSDRSNPGSAEDGLLVIVDGRDKPQRFAQLDLTRFGPSLSVPVWSVRCREHSWVACGPANFEVVLDVLHKKNVPVYVSNAARDLARDVQTALANNSRLLIEDLLRVKVPA